MTIEKMMFDLVSETKQNLQAAIDGKNLGKVTITSLNFDFGIDYIHKGSRHVRLLAFFESKSLGIDNSNSSVSATTIELAYEGLVRLIEIEILEIKKKNKVAN